MSAITRILCGDAAGGFAKIRNLSPRHESLLGEFGQLFTTRRTHFSYTRYLELCSKKPEPAAIG